MAMGCATDVVPLNDAEAKQWAWIDAALGQKAAKRASIMRESSLKPSTCHNHVIRFTFSFVFFPVSRDHFFASSQTIAVRNPYCTSIANNARRLGIEFRFEVFFTVWMCVCVGFVLRRCGMNEISTKQNVETKTLDLWMKPVVWIESFVDDSLTDWVPRINLEMGHTTINNRLRANSKQRPIEMTIVNPRKWQFLVWFSDDDSNPNWLNRWFVKSKMPATIITGSDEASSLLLNEWTNHSMNSINRSLLLQQQNRWSRRRQHIGINN